MLQSVLSAQNIIKTLSNICVYVRFVKDEQNHVKE